MAMAMQKLLWREEEMHGRPRSRKILYPLAVRPLRYIREPDQQNAGIDDTETRIDH
jgi:hypothetical protein